MTARVHIMTFVDRIAGVWDIAEVFELVNEFVEAVHHAGEIQKLPREVRPGRIYTADDLSYWWALISEEIKQREASDGRPQTLRSLCTLSWRRRYNGSAPAGFTERGGPGRRAVASFSPIRRVAAQSRQKSLNRCGLSWV